MITQACDVIARSRGVDQFERNPVPGEKLGILLAHFFVGASLRADVEHDMPGWRGSDKPDSDAQDHEEQQEHRPRVPHEGLQRT